MGGCIGLSRNRTESFERPSSNTSPRNSGNARKNQALYHDGIRWKSDVPLTEGQLRSKRDEFWDTAPAFDGRKEIWDAIRAAVTANESSDFSLAQAILDGANITVPGGYLTECYDELGTRYQVGYDFYAGLTLEPTTCGLRPVLLSGIAWSSAYPFPEDMACSSWKKLSDPAHSIAETYTVPVYCLSYPINIVREDGRDSPAECSEPVDTGTECVLKLRVSISCADVKLKVSSKDTIATTKRKLQEQEGIEVARQRWYFGGKLLGDKLRIEETKVQPGFVIQVVVNPEILSKVDS